MKVIVEGEGEWEFPDDATDGEIAVAINREQGLGPRGVPEFAGRPAGFEPQTRGPLLSALPAQAPRPIPGLEATGFGAEAAPQNPFMNQPVGPPAGGSPTGVSLPPGPLPPAGGAALPPQVNPLREAMLARRRAAGGAPLASLGPEAVRAAGAAAAQPIPQTQSPGVLEGAPQALGAGLVDVARSAASMPRVAARLGEGLADQILGETAGALARKLGEIAPQRIAGDFLEEKLMKPASDFYEGGEAARRDARDVPVGEKLKEPGWLLRQGLRQVPQLATSLGSAGAANAPKLARLAAPFVMEAGETARNLEEHEEATGKKLGNLAFGGAVVGKGAVAAGLELAGAEAILGRLAKYAPAGIRRKLGTTATKLLTGSVGEGGTERAQNLVGNFAEMMATEKPSMRDLFERAKTPEFWQALDEGGAESQVLGSLLGTAGSVGTAAGTMRRAGRIADARAMSEAEATWRAEDPEGRRVVPPETIDAINEGVRALQNPETADEGLRRLKLQTEALDARLQGLREPGATRAPEAAVVDPEGRRVVPQATIDAINEGVRDLVPGAAPRPGLLDDVLARTERPNALGDVLGATRTRDRATDAAQRRFQAERDAEERKRIAETPGAALRLILGDDPIFQPMPPAPAAETPGVPVERRMGPTPLLDWIDARTRDVDEDRRSLPPEEWTHDEARYFALTDGRTGLPNAQAYEIAARQSPDAYHVVLDVDGLKGINDVFGHEVGDEYLETVALVGRANGVRLFRYGGDEFTAIHTGDEASLRSLMETFRTALQETPVVGAKRGGAYPTHGGFSYGYGRNFREADARAYEDKHARKARREAGANHAASAQPVGVGGGARPETAPGQGNPAGVPPPVRRRGGNESGGTPGTPPAGPASLPPPVAPAAAAAPREAAPAPPPARPALAPTGREGEAFTAGGERVGVRWAIVDAFDDLIPSHEETGAGDLVENPAFAQELQPRDRSRVASSRQIEEIAKDLRPGALGESYYATDGAPIVGDDRIVESGNGRTLAVRRAYRTGRAEAYRKWVEEHAADFGLTPEQARGMKAPMLVRVRTTPAADRAELAKQMNVPTVARMSAAETGRADADRLTPALLSRFQPSDDGLALLAARNRDFVAGFLETVPENERSELLDEDGQLSKAGITRIQNALLGKAYGKAPVLERITESTDDNTRLVSTALLNAAPAMAGLKGEIEAGNVRRDMDPTDAIVEAVQKLSWLRETGGTVESYLQQTGLFGDEMTPAGREVLEAFDKFKRSGKKLTSFLTELVDGATLEGDVRQQGLFASDTPAPLADIVRAARRSAADGGQGDLFSGGEGVPAPDGDGASPRGVPDGGPSGTVDGGRKSVRPLSAAPSVAEIRDQAARLAEPFTRGARRHTMLVERWVRAISDSWKDAPRIVVVSSEEKLPDGIRSYAEGAGATGTIEGLYTGRTDDTAYIVASKVRSYDDAVRVVLHEVVGHAGVQRIIGRDAFNDVMDGIARSLPLDIENKIREYELDKDEKLSPEDRRREAAEEVLAEWASRPEAPPRAITRAMVAIRGWLRRIFPNLKWTPEDVRGLLARARRRVEEGGGERGAGNGAKMSRVPGDRGPGESSPRNTPQPERREKRTLYRAADYDYAQQGESFSASKSAAKAYLDNPGFGGRTLYRVEVEVDPERVLDLRSDGESSREQFQTLATVLDRTVQSLYGYGEFVHNVWERNAEIRDALAERFDWVRFSDEFPEGSETWTYLGTEDVDLEEVRPARPNPSAASGAPRFSRAQESTPEFKRWFGDSKVVDAAGRPKVVYHGTRAGEGVAEFTPSNGGEFGPGIYFTDDPGAAHFYAEDVARGVGGPTLVPVYLSLRNPFRVTKAEWLRLTEKRTPRQVRERLEARGYDGLIGEELTGGRQQFVAFRREQIKSATGNSGAFDPTNPDIRFSRRLDEANTTDHLGGDVREQLPLFSPDELAHAGAEDARRGAEQALRDLSGHRGGAAFRGAGRARGLAGAGIRTRAEVLAGLVRRDGVDFRGIEVKSPEDLAVAARVVRDPRLETLRVFYVKGGRIVGHEAWTSRMPAMVRFSPERREKLATNIRRKMLRFGADGWYLLHNHPSGNPDPSSEDRAFSERLAKEVDGFKGSVVIDHEWYGLVTNQGTRGGVWLRATYRIPEERQSPDPVELTRESAPKVDSPSRLAEFGREVGGRKGFATVLYLDNKLRIVGVQDVPHGRLLKSGNVDFFRGQIRKFGAVMIAGYAGDDVYGKETGWRRDAVLVDGLEPLFVSGLMADFVVEGERTLRDRGSLKRNLFPVAEYYGPHGTAAEARRDIERTDARRVGEEPEEYGARFSRAPSAAEERVYQRLKENARRKAQEAREAAQRVLDEVADPGDILEARRDETLPEHSAAIQRKLVPAGRKEDVEPLLNPVEALYQKAVRRHYAVEKTSARIGADKGPAHLDPGVVAELSAGHAARAEQFIEGKGGFRLTKDGGIEWTGNRSLAEILKPLGKGRLNELRRYLVARRVIELHARKASTAQGDMFPEVAKDRSILSGISEAAARSEVAGAPEDVKQAAEEITALLDDALQYWAEAGGLSPEAVRVIREMNRAYVPFYRIFEGHDPAAKAGKLVLPAERGKALQAEQAVKRLVGSSRDILDPLVSTVDHIQRMIRAADLNRVGKTLVEAAAKNPDAAVGLVERVTPQRDPAAPKEGDAVQKVAAAYDVEVTDEAAEAIGALSDQKLWFDNDRIRVWKDGKLEEYRVERSLAESLRALGPQDADVFQKLFTFPSTLLRGGVTKVPLFAWFNFGRDTGDAAVQSRNGFVPLVDSEIGLAEAIRNGDLRKEWLAAGGGYATLAAGGVKGAESALRSIAPRTKAGTVIKTLRHPLEALSLLNRPFEEAARLGEYRRAKMAGKSATEAALDAARVTTNFTVHGSSAFLWGILKASAFSNPALQGTDKAFRTVFAAPRGQKQTPALAGKAAVNVLFKGLLYVGGLSVLFGLLGDDDDEIKELRRTKAGAAWWFARVPGSEVIVRIPKPFLWGQLFGTGVEAMLDRMRDENPVAFQEWRTQVLEMITDGAVPIPTPLKVGFELATNRSIFFKRPIVPRGLEGVEGRYQYGPRTSETAKAAGRLTGLSPAKIEYGVGQVGGTLGREALRTSDAIARAGGDVEKPAARLGDLPLVGRAFASTPTTSSDSIETFYDELKDVRGAVETARHLKKTDPEEWERRRPELRRKILLSRRYESVADQIGDIRKRIVKVEKRADLSAEEKRTRIDGLMRRQTAIARRLVERRWLKEPK